MYRRPFKGEQVAELERRTFEPLAATSGRDFWGVVLLADDVFERVAARGADQFSRSADSGAPAVRSWLLSRGLAQLSHRRLSSGMARDEFSKDVARRLAARAGYRCSYPGCGTLTVGPAADMEDGVITTGVAAHITAAAPNGPRFDASLSGDERRAIANGIWLCSSHGTMVDRDVVTYSVEVLRGWKLDHETRIGYIQKGLPDSRPFVARVKIERLGPIEDSTIELGKATLLLGKNGSGKTLICRVLDCLADPAKLDEWARSDPEAPPQVVEVTFFTEREHHYRRTTRGGTTRFVVDGEFAAVWRSPWCVIYAHQRDGSGAVGSLGEFASMFGCSQDELRLVVEKGQSTGLSLVDDITLNGDSLRVRVKGGASYRSYASLSGGERTCVDVEIAANLAREVSRFRPVVLILDGMLTRIDDYRRAHVFEFLKREDMLFQSLATLPSWSEDSIPDGFVVQRLS